MTHEIINAAGVPKPGWLEDKARKLGLSYRDIYRVEYNELLEILGLVIEGKFKVLPLEEVEAPK